MKHGAFTESEFAEHFSDTSENIGTANKSLNGIEGYLSAFLM